MPEIAFKPRERRCPRCGTDGTTVYGLLRLTHGVKTYDAVVCCTRCYLDGRLEFALSVAEWLKANGYEVPRERCPWG